MEHEKVHVICENLCLEEGMTKEQIKEQTIFYFNNAGEMKASNHLKSGMSVQTLGYYSVNDGGGALYHIRDTKPDDFYEELDNELYAELIVDDNTVNVLQFGVDNTNTNYVSDLLNVILEKFKGYEIFLPKGTYKLNDTLKIDANTTLFGAGKNSTILTTNDFTGNFIELKDSFSYNVSIHDLSLNGNYKAEIGIYIHKTEFSVETVDMKLQLEHLNLSRFTDWCMKIGGDENERVIADSYYNDIICNQFTGGGILLTNRCTDSYFNNIRVGGGSIAGKENFVVRGYNLHFSNCKSFYSGIEENPKDAWLFENCACIYGEIEAQDTTHYGVKITGCNAINLIIMADRCTLATDDNPAVYVQNTHYSTIKVISSNYEGSTQFQCNKVMQLINCHNLNLSLYGSNMENFLEILSNDNSYNITYNINGYEIFDVTPEFNEVNYDQNGITAKNVGNNQLLIQGTSTAQCDINLKGAFGNSEILSRIPKNSLVKFITQNEYVNDVIFQVFNVTTVLTGKPYSLFNFNDETNVTGLTIRIPNNTTINKIITPQILVVRNTTNI